MKRNIKNLILKIASITLSLILVLPFVSHASYSNQNIESEYDNNKSGRSNLKFEVGSPGDRYLIYSYIEDGKSYKVIEFSDSEFKNVHSEVYVLNENGNYVHTQNKETEIADNGVYTLTTASSNGRIEVEKSTLPKQEIIHYESNRVMAGQFYTDPGTGKWLYKNYNGDTKIENMTISGITAALGAAIGAFIGGAPGAIIGSGIGAAASSYFSKSADRAYYRINYKWMMSKLHPVALVLRENCVTKFYLDSGHKYYVGRDEYNWDGRW